MKRLIAIATLGLTLSFSSLSFAHDYMDLYTKPIVKSEVKNEIGSENVEKDCMNLYTTPIMGNITAPLIADENSNNEHISVFSVKIPLSSRTQA